MKIQKRFAIEDIITQIYMSNLNNSLIKEMLVETREELFSIILSQEFTRGHEFETLTLYDVFFITDSLAYYIGALEAEEL